MNKTKNKLLPELRFPEYVNDGAWVEKTLDQTAEIVTGNTPSTSESAYYSGKFLFVSPADINDNRYVLQTKTTLTKLGFSKTRHIKANSILFVCIGSIGKVAQNKIECATNQQINSLLPFNDYSSDFIYSLLEFNASRIAELAGIQVVPIVNKKLFSSVKLLFPSKKHEQQKIASCFSSLDEAIAAHSQKLELLKEHKKGLMQNLFPQEGEKVPKFRFPEFVNDGAWKEKLLEETSDINPKTSILPEIFVYIDLESVEDGCLHQKKIIRSEEAPSRAQRLLEENDVILQTVRPYQKNNFHFKNNDDYYYVASTGYAQLRAKESSMYLFQFLHTDRFVKKVLEKCTGSNYPAINSSELSQIPVQIPPKPKEQEKIASCLSLLDELIAAQYNKIKQLKLHKKGLMQALFPNNIE